jgi:hypothetical protein
VFDLGSVNSHLFFCEATELVGLHQDLDLLPLQAQPHSHGLASCTEALLFLFGGGTRCCSLNLAARRLRRGKRRIYVRAAFIEDDEEIEER